MLGVLCCVELITIIDVDQWTGTRRPVGGQQLFVLTQIRIRAKFPEGLLDQAGDSAVGASASTRTWRINESERVMVVRMPKSMPVKMHEHIDTGRNSSLARQKARVPM